MQRNNFPDFPGDEEWAKIPDATINAQPPPLVEPLASASNFETTESNQLIAEELHERDQQQLLAHFPSMASVQRKVAARDFCRYQQLRIYSIE